MPHCNKPASVAPSSASNRGLYDPTFERDSCGVGFVADMSGRKSNATIQSGLQVLKNLQHRGACGCDQDTGDGAGILMQLPDLFFRSDNTSLSDRLPAAGDYGVAFVFLPQGMSDSAALDQVLAVLVQSGRSLPHALMMLVPEAYEGDRSLDPARRAFYQYHSGLVEPWDGPASLVFCDGIRIGVMLDRNGLRPGRHVVTHDNLVVLASEAGVLPIPPEAIRLSGRLQPGKIFLVDLAEGRIIGDEELKESICRAQPYGLWLEKHQIHLGDLPEPAKVYVERRIDQHQYMTNQEGVFAAGDCRRGQSLVVWAIAEGREAARHIDHYLTGQSSTLRARDRSLVQIEPLPLAVPGT